MNNKALLWRSITIWGLIFALILLPFAFYGERLEALTTDLIAAGGGYSLGMAVVFTLFLASDVFLPVPSSVLSTAAGYLWGFSGGLAISLLGMTLGCLVGFALARGFKRIAAERWLGKDPALIKSLHHRYNDWLIIVCRPVPVLAEASVFYAALAGMPVKRFLFLTAGSNLGISLIYAAAGAYSANLDSLLYAFGAAVAIPGFGLLIGKRFLRPDAAPANDA